MYHTVEENFQKSKDMRAQLPSSIKKYNTEEEQFSEIKIEPNIVSRPWGREKLYEIPNNLAYTVL